MKLLILSGRRRVGKDTVADLIIEELGRDNVVRLALGDLIKELFCQFTGMTLKEVNEKKNDGECIVLNGLNMRCLLINFSQTLQRQFGRDIWCKYVEQQFSKTKLNLITDIRRLADYKYFKTRYPSSQCWRISRLNGLPDNFEKESEVELLPYDYLINNFIPDIPVGRHHSILSNPELDDWLSLFTKPEAPQPSPVQFPSLKSQVKSSIYSTYALLNGDSGSSPRYPSTPTQ